ncbi:nitrous oxide reductase accessory protein NosL [Ralstonia sp. Ralssp135]|uniref:nitrous oxide reductase accessory protein NosL n=1 Tax=Ralstonia sp. Ralssp135 TaxID=3243016 RepID=UPI0039AEFCAA
MKRALQPSLSALRRRARSALFATAIVLAGCQGAASTPGPIELTRDTPCSLDGMTVTDFPGPKAQILYDKGTPDVFCDTIELFSIVLRPEQQRHMLAMYVQDMAKTDWNTPRGHWIDARTAFYVVGSKARGSMGATFASFATQADADAFATHQGGKVYKFNEITPQMAQLDGGVLKDHQM